MSGTDQQDFGVIGHPGINTRGTEQGEIANQFQRLSHTIAEIDGAITDLLRSIDPILLPEGIDKDPGSPSAPFQGSEIAKGLDEQTDRLQRILTVVIRVIGRVDL